MPGVGLSDNAEVDFRHCAHILFFEDQSDVIGKERPEVGEEELEALKDVVLCVLDSDDYWLRAHALYPSSLRPHWADLVFDSSGPQQRTVAPLHFDVKLTAQVKVEPAMHLHSYLVVFQLLLLLIVD